MAKITEVDIISSADETADYVLVVRGSQQDVKRLLINGLPTVFDLHDDVATELTSPADADRLLISDEGSAGAPQKYVRLSTLLSFFGFDLHDHVATELASAADNDRLLISDESAAGAPQKWITAENLLAEAPGKYEKLTDEIELYADTGTITHSLGREPIGFQARLINKTADHGWSPGDELLFPYLTITQSGGDPRAYFLSIYDVTSSEFKFVTPSTSSSGVLYIPDKDSLADEQSPATARWRWGLTIWG